MEITWGLKDSPLDRTPQPQHADFKHNGWNQDCPLCIELMIWTEEKTGIKSTFEDTQNKRRKHGRAATRNPMARLDDLVLA